MGEIREKDVFAISRRKGSCNTDLQFSYWDFWDWKGRHVYLISSTTRLLAPTFNEYGIYFCNLGLE